MIEPTCDARPRLHALDCMRGFVMVLMSIDHASGAFNAGRLFTDSAHFYKPGTPLPTAQFLTRFITHLCAPTFVFLAGAAGALSAERRIARGEPAHTVDRHLATRGALIAVLDPLWMSWAFTGGQFVLLQVLYAIGTSMIAMTIARRLGTCALVAAALVLMFGGEALTGLILRMLHGSPPPLAAALPLTGGSFGPLLVGYPTLPWLAIMMLGWAFGRGLAFGFPTRIGTPERPLAYAGLAGLLCFVLVRGANGYGNMHLLRADGSLVQWLHVSKYPPGISYYALELGMMALILSWFLSRERRGRSLPFQSLLGVLGRTAFFFYLLHVHLLEGAAWLLGLHAKLGLWSAYAGGAAIVVLLYPACLRYDAYKRAHPHGFTRYL